MRTAMVIRLLIVLVALIHSGCALLPPADTAVPASAPAAASIATPEMEKPAATVESSPPTSGDSRRMLTLQDFAETNDERLLQVQRGMHRQTVEQIMDGYQAEKWINPFKRQSYTDADGKAYEVLFYLTRPPRAGQRISENFLSPVIFQEERVVSIGRYPLKKLRRSACVGRTEACSK